jgi:hypothetical protein
MRMPRAFPWLVDPVSTQPVPVDLECVEPRFSCVARLSGGGLPVRGMSLLGDSVREMPLRRMCLCGGAGL